MIALLPLDVCVHVSQILHKLQCDFIREYVPPPQFAKTYIKEKVISK